MLLLTSLFLIVSFCSNTYALEKGNDDKAIVFALDISGSMKTNDPDRLAIDSIMQMMYTPLRFCEQTNMWDMIHRTGLSGPAVHLDDIKAVALAP